MSAVGFVAGVVAAFFAIGIAVGVIGVVALGAIRGRQRATDRPRGRRAHADAGLGGDEEDGSPPRWPGR